MQQMQTDLSYKTDQANTYTTFSVGGASNQEAAIQGLDGNLNLPYTQHLASMGAAGTIAATNSAANFMSFIASTASTMTATVSANQVAAEAVNQAASSAYSNVSNTSEGSLLSGTTAITGSMQSASAEVADAAKAYQDAKSSVDKTYRVAIQIAERNFEEDGDENARDSAVASAKADRDSALEQIRESYVSSVVDAQNSHRKTLASEETSYRNNVSQAYVRGVESTALAEKTFANTFSTNVASLANELAEDLSLYEQQHSAEEADAIDSTLATSTDPWSAKERALSSAYETAADAIWSAYYDRAVEGSDAGFDFSLASSDANYENTIAQARADAEQAVSESLAAEEKMSSESAQAEENIPYLAAAMPTAGLTQGEASDASADENDNSEDESNDAQQIGEPADVLPKSNPQFVDKDGKIAAALAEYESAISDLENALTSISPSDVKRLVDKGFINEETGIDWGWELRSFSLGGTPAGVVVNVVNDSGTLISKLEYRYHERNEVTGYSYSHGGAAFVSTFVSFQLSKSHAPTLSDEVILSVERTARAAFALEAGVVAISVLPGGSSAVYIDDGQYGWAALAFVQDVGETVLVVGKVGEGASALIKLGKLGDKLSDLRKAGAINDKFMHALIAGTQGASAAINGAGAVQAIGEGDGTTAAMRSFDALFSAIGAGMAASKLRKAKAKLDNAIQEAVETSQEVAGAPTRGTSLVEYDPRFAARQMGLDPEKFASLPPLRQQYVTSVYGLRYQGQALRQAGKGSEEIARILHAERRAISTRFKDLTPPHKLAQIYARNLDKYGDKLGPTIEWLRGPGNKTWEEIIESASRAGGADLGF